MCYRYKQVHSKGVSIINGPYRVKTKITYSIYSIRLSMAHNMPSCRRFDFNQIHEVDHRRESTFCLRRSKINSNAI
nr:MAG TPA: hypothetical protein [Caudoviricetes sp.]